ncbi:acyl-CoA carboxylase subunit epsilon [Streptomyces sp. NPDC051207]|uniref:acyl-CoA carboxylase subunit epsilon n=1 Tax=Streptomyces sp. NPDC051207 TaxID=3154641 RepID=UPI003439B001
MTTPARPAAPHLTVLRGDPDPEDLAALLAVVMSGGGAPEPVDPGPLRAGWDRTHRATCLPAGSWRSHR